MQLEGTSITDEGLEILGRMPRLRGVNVANCTNVTANGLLKLVQSDTIEDITFSCHRVTPEDVVRIIGAVTRINRIEIIDPGGQLHAGVLQRAANAKNIKLYVRDKGALQNMLDFQSGNSR